MNQEDEVYFSQSEESLEAPGKKEIHQIETHADDFKPEDIPPSKEKSG